jgi:hypothetical protein
MTGLDWTHNHSPRHFHLRFFGTAPGKPGAAVRWNVRQGRKATEISGSLHRDFVGLVSLV